MRVAHRKPTADDYAAREFVTLGENVGPGAQIFLVGVLRGHPTARTMERRGEIKGERRIG
jgi:hypothetical protein